MCYEKKIGEIQKLLKLLEKEDDLKGFNEEQGEAFSKEHKLQPGQLNFLLAVVAAKRTEENKLKNN